MNIDHIVLWVSDQKRSLDFYVNVVGLDPVLSQNSIAFFHQRFPDRNPTHSTLRIAPIARIMARMALNFWSTAAHTIGMMLAGWIHREQEAVVVLSLRGPVRYAVLVVMDLQSRRVQIAGIVQEPYEDWREYVAHYHEERPHQGRSSRLIAAATDHRGHGPLARRQRLGGLLNHYYREAA